MRKVTPDPPEADNASAPENPAPRKPDVDDVHTSYADIRATPRKPPTMLIVDPEIGFPGIHPIARQAERPIVAATATQTERFASFPYLHIRLETHRHQRQKPLTDAPSMRKR